MVIIFNPIYRSTKFISLHKTNKQYAILGLNNNKLFAKLFIQVVKLGIASEQAKEFVEGESDTATKGLLSDYSITPGTNLPMRTPRTPAQQDNILQVNLNATFITFIT